MKKEIFDVKEIRLAHTRDGVISITHVERPYGEHSNPLVSLSLSNHGEKVDSVIEIPYENIEEVILGLRKSSNFSKTIEHEQFHGELDSDIGGGS